MYDWIESTFNVSGGATQAIAVVLALVVVLLLFSLFVFVLKRLMGSNAPLNRSRQPRVAVMDSTTVDTRRRLVLIRRDNIEHLLLIGGPSDVVVEQNIVRNAPIAGTRHLPNTAAAQTGQSQLKVPTAPGPDIPFKPDETAPQPQAAPRKNPPMSAPMRQASAGPSALTSAKPVTPERVAQPTPPKNSSEPVPFEAVPQKDLPDQAPTEPVRSTNTAANLLRAATQNGFNRSSNAAPAPKVEPVTTAPAETSIGEAPAVKVEPQALSEAGPDKMAETGSSFRNLARSIAGRERPSQSSGHTITPPASGPAARAKTALLKPVETPGAGAKSETVLAEPDLQIGEEIVEKAETDNVPAEALGAEITAEALETDTGPSQDMSEAAPETVEEPVFDEDPQDKAVEAVEPETAEMLPASAEETVSEETPAQKEIKLDLDLADLMEEDVPPSKPDEYAPQKRADTERQPAQTQVQAAKTTAPVSSTSALLEIVPGAPQGQAAPRVVQGLGDKNPIEDEMAKILYELGGQPNQ
ncbi:hypothetical protein ABVF61_03425 [Roseibium sp. HPY-6]|uniref:hypothetical protein n=1 Tax=Roseibium sp. HPY-6 TaxID=3229852 RepID=UPI0033901BC8